VETSILMGEWKTLDAGEPLSYLKFTANCIFSDCPPIIITSFSLDNSSDMTVKTLALIARKRVSHLQIFQLKKMKLNTKMVIKKLFTFKA